ncbi:MAG TPA: 3-dehydroquinate synthase [Vicinamibacteria bacterium]|nr:3-dehydroquinate synthase [Vicinamibacteria bacterium]
MSSPPRIRSLQRRGDPYPVYLGEGLLHELGFQVRKLWPGRRIGVVSQARIWKIHGSELASSFLRAGVDMFGLQMPEGEDRKALETVSRLYDRLVGQGFTREDALVAFGGGTVGDTAGFVAATYLRGVPYAQVPTTLLAQIDSAIGAKVGVNHPRAKNLIGAIHRPRAVFLDPGLLSTLPEREFHSGLFELIKYGFIGRPRLLKRMESAPLRPGERALVDSIADGVARKLEVVREDESEQGLRRILNFGHTIGHGLEAAGDYRTLTHGEAVGWGMVGAIRLARRRERLSPSLAERLEAAVRSVGTLPSLRNFSKRRTLDAVSKDKKIGKLGLRFILPVGWGRVEIVESFPKAEIAWALESLGVGRR